MKNVNRMKHQSAVLFAGVGFLVGMAVTALVFNPLDASAKSDAADSVQEAPGQPSTVARDVIVDYMYESDPGTASGHNSLEAESVEFHPGYVIVTDTAGRSSLFAVDRLRRFSYRQADSN